MLRIGQIVGKFSSLSVRRLAVASDIFLAKNRSRDQCKTKDRPPSTILPRPKDKTEHAERKKVDSPIDFRMTPPGPSSSFRLTYHIGDLTATPPASAVLIHSCNCLGEWGSGVALALRQAFPAAYAIYAAHCHQHPAAELLGTCLIIAPQDENEGGKWIACLFTSEGYGRKTKLKPGKSKATDIKRFTKMALESLKENLEEHDTHHTGSGDGGPEKPKPKPNLQELWACKFNSGSFGVKWESTVDILQTVFETWRGEMKIVSPS